MRIMIVNVVCGQGSTGKISLDLYNEYKALGFEARICYGRGSKRENPDLIRISSKPGVYLHALLTRLTGWVGKGSRGATNRLFREIEEFKPDIVHLHNIHGYYVDAYRLLAYLKSNNIPTVITMHDEWLYTGKCGHAYSCKRWQASCGECPQIKEYPKSLVFDRSAKELAQKREAFSGFESLIFAPVCAWLEGQARLSPFLAEKRFTVAHNGIDLDVFRPRETDNLREKHNIKDEKIIVHVTPNFEDPCKGGRFVLDLARRLKDENAKIIVVGVKKPIENCPENLIAINRTENQARLAEYYSLGDVFLITSEMECLPTVCLEALCCGTPVLGFEAGGTSETAPAPYGVFVPHGDMEELEKAARDILSGETALAAQAECAEFGRRQYGKSGMTQRYLEIYNAILGKDSDERL